MTIFVLVAIALLIAVVALILSQILSLMIKLTADTSSIMDFISKKTAMDIADDLFKNGYELKKRIDD